MNASEIAAFEALPHFEAACRLRRYDDIAKDPGADVPPQAAISTPRITATTMVAPDVRATDLVPVGRSIAIALSPSANCRMPMTADPRSPAGLVKPPSRFVRARRCLRSWRRVSRRRS